jgi:glycosidase
MTGGSGWHRHPHTGLWYWAMFLPFQPDLNYYHPAVGQQMLGVARHWLGMGVDGFRLDIFNCLYEDSLFRNNPLSLRPLPSEDNPNGLFQQFRHQLNHPRTLGFAERLRTLVDSFSQHPVLIGEVFGPLAATRRYLGEAENNRLSLAFAFQTVSMRLGARSWHRMTQRLEAAFQPPFTPVYVFSNHDRTRSLYRLNGDLRKARLLAFYQLTVRGVPTIYMGEELGVNQASEQPIARARDPLAQKYARLPRWVQEIARRKTVAFNRDECRTPMPWSGSLPNAGFSSGQPWLPLQQDWKQTNAATQALDSTRSLLGFYRRLLAVRKATPALQHGSLVGLERAGRHGLCYRRVLEGQTPFTIILNTGSRPLRLPEGWLPPRARAILTTGSPWPALGIPTQVPPYTGWLLQGS